MVLIIALALAGIAVSLYAWYLEKQVKADPSFKPVCDISDKISCTKPILSQYNSLLYIPNWLLGVAFYAGILVLGIWGNKELLFYASIMGIIASLVLAYLLYVKIRVFCLVCTAIHLINIAIFVVAAYHYYY